MSAGHSIDRMKTVLDAIIEGYDNLRNYESNGTTKDVFVAELIKIRDACDEIPSLLIQTLKDVNFDISKMGNLPPLLSTNFVNTMRIQITMLLQPNLPTSIDWIKGQASISVNMMNLNDEINKLRMLRAVLK